MSNLDHLVAISNTRSLTARSPERPGEGVSHREPGLFLRARGRKPQAVSRKPTAETRVAFCETDRTD